MPSAGPTLSEQAQVTLLLCGPLLAAKEKGVAPLSPGEFNKVTSLFEAHGAPLADLLRIDPSVLKEKLGPEVDAGQISALLGRGFLLSLAIEKWQSAGIWVRSRGESGYPTRLSERLKQHAPPLLYGCGDASLLEHGGVAIVGSRDVDDAGSEFTTGLAAQCARERLTVISGGAKGVDKIAMNSAASNDGRVVGVLADSLYRAATSSGARDLLREKRVVLVSPFDPEAGFNVGNAMSRNKVIYALADYGVVVSSGVSEGGTWAGAVEQLERFKHSPLFVRTGESVPAGNHALIKKGAIPFSLPRNGTLRAHFEALPHTPPEQSQELLLNL